MKKFDNLRTESNQQIREARERRILKKMGNEKFASQVKRAASLIKGGKTFFDARIDSGITSQQLWEDVQYAVAQQSFSREKAAIELQTRMKNQYEMAIDYYLRAVKENNTTEIGKAIMIMSRLDERTFEFLRELDLLKPQREVDGGHGYHSNDVLDVENEMKEKLEQRLLNQIGLSQTFTGPKPIALLTRDESNGNSNIVEQTPLAARDTSGQVTENSDSKSQSNGSIDIQHFVVPMVSKDQPS